MAMNVPFPFRVAAGVLGVGIDSLRSLPEDLPAAAVSLAGHALRASMRVQQEVAHLATRGEELLAPLVDRPEEHPAWARFDDEEPVDEADGLPAAVTDGDRHGAGAGSPAGATPDVDGNDDPDPSDPPSAFAEYDEWGIADLRARLGELTPADIAALLAYERSGRARAAHLTMLQNRLTSAEAAASARGRRR